MFTELLITVALILGYILCNKMSAISLSVPLLWPLRGYT